VVPLGCALAALSLAAPVLSTTDPYEYVATGMLGLRAYAPPAGAFIGTAYEAINGRIPLIGVIYGPLWVLIDTAQTALGSSMYQKIEAIRLWNLVFVALSIWFFARAGLSRAALIAFALNPAVWYFSVANPHAEIEGVTLLAAAYACACRSKTVAATAFLVAAGLVKLPFVIVGGALLGPLRGAWPRCRAWFAAIAIVCVLSSAVPGGAYLSTLWHYAGVRASSAWPAHWVTFAPVLMILTLWLVARSRGYLGAAWLFHQMAPIAAPWYIFWGIPYALATAGLELYLVVFPLAATQTFCDYHSVAPAASRAGMLLLIVAGIGLFIFDVGASRHVQKRIPTSGGEPLPAALGV
jgi:hypothetical protein